jgi:hypothetical protein
MMFGVVMLGACQSGPPDDGAVESACFWEARLSGTVNDTYTSEVAHFQRFDQSLLFNFHDPETLNTASTSLDRLPPGELGTFDDVVVTFTLAGNPLDTFSAGPDHPVARAQLIIESNDGEQIEGTISGTFIAANIADPDNPRLVDITLEFLAREADFFGAGPSLCTD